MKVCACISLAQKKNFFWWGEPCSPLSHPLQMGLPYREKPAEGQRGDNLIMNEAIRLSPDLTHSRNAKCAVTRKFLPGKESETQRTYLLQTSPLCPRRKIVLKPTDKESTGSARGNTCEKFPAMTVHMCRRGGTCKCEVPPSGTPVSSTRPSGWPGQSSQTSLRETSASSLQHLAWDPRRPSVDVVRRWQLCSGLPRPWAWSYTALPRCSACSDKTHNTPKHLREKQPIRGKVCAATRANTTHSQMASFSHAQKG